MGDRPLLWSTLGQSLMKHGEWQEATIAFRAALKQRPDAYDYAWLADALDRLHQPEEAATMRRDGLMLTLRRQQSFAVIPSCPVALRLPGNRIHKIIQDASRRQVWESPRAYISK